MSDNGEVYRLFLFDRDNIGTILQGNFTAHIHKYGEEVEIQLERGVLWLKQTGHDENFNHVFDILYFVDDYEDSRFRGLLKMEHEGSLKCFSVTSSSLLSQEGIEALRQILPDENISNDILASYPNEGNDEEVQDEYYEEEEEEENDPALNLGDRFADAADEASVDDASDDEELFQI